MGKAYITRCKTCQGINFACATSMVKDASQALKRAAAEGLDVATVTDEEVRAGEWCKCHREPAQPQLALEEVG